MTTQEAVSAEMQDGQALYSESHWKDPHPFRTRCWQFVMFENPIGRFIWKPTLEDDMLVYRPFWKL